MLSARTGTAAMVAALLFNVSLAGGLAKDGPYDLPGVKVGKAPTIDGALDPGEWPESARKQGFVDQDTNVVSDEFAEFWVVYDEANIYFAARVKTDPTKLIADEYRQNTSFQGDDNVGFAVDAVSNGSQGNMFRANSRGATSIDLAGGRAAKTEWLGEIAASARKTSDGWQVELRIPWGLMSLPSPGSKNLPFNVFWYRSNKQNTYTYKYFNRDVSLLPAWTGVEVPAVAKERTMKLLPYLYGGFQKDGSGIFNAGLDFKANVTDSLTFVGTLNPDFRNVEASVLSLDFSYFERLAGESRPFFQEGAGYISTGMDQRLFASQRIRNIDSGVKLYGQLDERTSLGFLSTFDFGKQTATALSATHRLSNKQDLNFAYVGNNQAGLKNDAAQLNYTHRFGPYMAYVNTQGTDDEVRGSGWRNSTGVQYSNSGLTALVEHNYVSKDFFPRLGFSPEQDLKGFFGFVEYEQTPNKGPVTSWALNGFGGSYNRTTGGFYRDTVAIGGEMMLRSKWAAGFQVEHSKFNGSNDHLYVFGVGRVEGPNRGYAVNYHWGEFGGVPYERIDLEASFKPTGNSQVSWSTQLQEFNGSETQHILSLRYDIGKYESIGGRGVYENGQWNWYLSYRMSGKRGVEYFVLLGDPQAGSFQNRLVFKLVLPLEVKY